MVASPVAKADKASAVGVAPCKTPAEASTSTPEAETKCLYESVGGNSQKSEETISH